MYEFKDLSGRTSWATAAVGVYMLADLMFSIADFAIGQSAPEELGIVELLGAIQFLMILVCVVIVGRWIYRASANAHVISDSMTISPGWAVGWYFVPFANLVKPFQAMKEVWLASHRSGSRFEEKTPALLGWWWGLWLANNFISNIYFQLTVRSDADPQTAAGIGLLSTATNIPLCIVLVMLMREVANAQKSGVYEEVFA